MIEAGESFRYMQMHEIRQLAFLDEYSFLRMNWQKVLWHVFYDGGIRPEKIDTYL